MATKIQIWNRAASAAGETRRIDSESDTSNVPSILADIWDDLVREVMSAKEWAWAKTQAPLTEIGEQSIAYIADGSKTVFTVPYDIGDASQVTVTKSSVELTLGTDYTYTAPDGGFPSRITFLVAPVLGATIDITVDTTRVGWRHVYALPSDCLRPLALLHDGVQLHGVEAHMRRHSSFVLMLNNSRSGYVLCTETDRFDALEYLALVTEPTVWPPHFVEALVRRLAAHLLDAVKKSPAEAQAMMQRYQAAVGEAVAVANSSTGQLAPPETPALVARGLGWSRWLR